MNSLPSNRRSPLGPSPGQAALRLSDGVVEALRSPHYRRRTEEAYLHWIRRFLAFHGCIHPRELAESDVNRFLIISPSVKTSPRPCRTRRWRQFLSFTNPSWNSPWIQSKEWTFEPTRSSWRRRHLKTADGPKFPDREIMPVTRRRSLEFRLNLIRRCRRRPKAGRA
jgi:hypothetical protein